MSKIITTLLIGGLLLKFGYIFIEQSSFSLEENEQTISSYFLIDYLADVLLISSGLLGIFYEGKFFDRKLINRYYLLVLMTTLVYLFSGASILDFSMLFGAKGIASMASLSILFTGSNNLRVKYISRFILALGIFLSFYVVVSLVSEQLVFSRKALLSRFVLINLNLMWISFYILLFYGRKFKNTAFIIFAISFVMSLVTSTRSFILMHLILLFYSIWQWSRLKFLTTIAVSLVGVGSYFYLSTTSFFSEAFDQFGGRLENDTRTDQLLQFILQINISDILLGAGSFAEWEWNGRAYQFLDNQILLMLWWAGLCPTLLYLSFFVLAMKKSRVGRNTFREYNNMKLLSILWVLALLGISVFTDISISLIHSLIFFSLGVLFSRKEYVFN